jgi:hypothetical protein
MATMDLYTEEAMELVADRILEGASSERLITLVDKCTKILMDRGCFVSLDIDKNPEDEADEIELELDAIEYSDNHLTDVDDNN